MYQKSETIQLKGSAAVFHNNLTILYNSKDKSTTYGVAGRNIFFMTKVDETGIEPVFKQVIPELIEKGGESESAQQVFNITETKFLKVADRSVLAILTTKAVFFYDHDGSHLIHAHKLGIHASSPDESSYARGVAAISPNIITIGTSSGIILLFEVASKATNMSQKNDIKDRHFQSGISTMISNPGDGILCVADTTRNLVVFSIKSTTNIKTETVINLDNTVTSLELFQDYVICGLGNGTITIYSIKDGQKLIDVAAHGRWINSLHVKNNLLVSTGEDCFFRVWELNEINDRLKITHLQSERVIDNLICSAQLSRGTNEICVSSFDYNQLLIYRLS